MLHASNIICSHQNETSENSPSPTKLAKQTTTTEPNVKTPSLKHITKATPWFASAPSIAHTTSPFVHRGPPGVRSTPYIFPASPVNLYTSMPSGTPFILVTTASNVIASPSLVHFRPSGAYASPSVISNATFGKPSPVHNILPCYVITPTTFQCQPIDNTICSTINNISSNVQTPRVIAPACSAIAKTTTPYVNPAPPFVHDRPPTANTSTVLYLSPPIPTTNQSTFSTLGSAVFSPQSQSIKSVSHTMSPTVTSMASNHYATPSTDQSSSATNHSAPATVAKSQSIVQVTSLSSHVSTSSAYVAQPATKVKSPACQRLVYPARCNANKSVNVAPSLVSTTFPTTKTMPQMANSKLLMNAKLGTVYTPSPTVDANLTSDIHVSPRTSMVADEYVKVACTKGIVDRIETDIIPNKSAGLNKTCGNEHKIRYPNYIGVDLNINNNWKKDQDNVQTSIPTLGGADEHYSVTTDTQSVEPVTDNNMNNWNLISQNNAVDDMSSKCNNTNGSQPPSADNGNDEQAFEQLHTDANQTICMSQEDNCSAPLDLCTVPKTSISSETQRTQMPHDYIISYYDDFDSQEESDFEDDENHSESVEDNMSPVAEPLNLSKTIPFDKFNNEDNDEKENSAKDKTLSAELLNEDSFDDDDDQENYKVSFVPTDMIEDSDKNRTLSDDEMLNGCIPGDDIDQEHYKVNFTPTDMVTHADKNRALSVEEMLNEGISDEDICQDNNKVNVINTDLKKTPDKNRTLSALEMLHEDISDDDVDQDHYKVSFAPMDMMDNSDKIRLLNVEEMLKNCISENDNDQDNYKVNFASTDLNETTSGNEMLNKPISDIDVDQDNYNVSNAPTALMPNMCTNRTLRVEEMLKECISDDEIEQDNKKVIFVCTDIKKIPGISDISDDDSEFTNEHISHTSQIEDVSRQALTGTQTGPIMTQSSVLNTMGNMLSHSSTQNILIIPNNAVFVGGRSYHSTAITNIRPVIDIMDTMSPQSTSRQVFQTVPTNNTLPSIDIQYQQASATHSQAVASSIDYTSQLNPVLQPDAARYDCNLCGKWFIGEQAVIAHVSTHKKAYKCKECSAAFNWLGNLREHIKVIHRKLRPFHCGVCAKSFSKKYHLQQHMTIHAGDTPYWCSVCGETFSFSAQLKRHSLQHLPPEKSHTCPICLQTFSDKNNMKMHFLRHRKRQANNI